MIILIIFAVLIIAVVLEKTLFPLVNVIGTSMFPTYSDGEVIFSTRLFNKKNLKRGDVITYRVLELTGEDRIVIKRVEKIDPVKGVYCLGDNAEVSNDSRYYGYVPFHCIVTKILFPRDKCVV